MLSFIERKDTLAMARHETSSMLIELQSGNDGVFARHFQYLFINYHIEEVCQEKIDNAVDTVEHLINVYNEKCGHIV